MACIVSDAANVPDQQQSSVETYNSMDFCIFENHVQKSKRMTELLDLYPLFNLSKAASSLSIAQVSLISTSIYMHMAGL